MAVSKNSLKQVGSKSMQQILIGLLFTVMGLIGFSSGSGLGGNFAGEIARLLGAGDRELVRYIVSVLLLVSGLVLLASLWVKALPTLLAAPVKTTVLILWIVLIVVLDILAVNFGRMNGSEWFVWIEQVVVHLIILGSIVTITRS